MHTIDWELQELFPYQGDALNALQEWFDSDANPFMNEHFSRGQGRHRYLTGSKVQKFYQADARHQLLDKRPGWRTQMSKRLYGLRRAISISAQHMDRLVKHATKPNDPFHNHFWYLRNCRPAGGEWHSLNHHPRRDNPTGHECWSRFCPWCWLRLHQKYLLACQQPSRYTLSSPGKRKRMRCMGFPELVNATIVDHEFTVPNEADRPPTEAAIPSTYEADVFLNMPCSGYVARAQRVFLRSMAGPGHPYLFRLASPLYREITVGTQLHASVGLRVGFLHTNEVDTEQISKQIPRTIVQTLRAVELSAALRWVRPFPIQWLRGQSFGIEKLRLLGCFYRLSNYGIRQSKQGGVRCPNTAST